MFPSEMKSYIRNQEKNTKGLFVIKKNNNGFHVHD